jgi:hypothetical protein
MIPAQAGHIGIFGKKRVFDDGGPGKVQAPPSLGEA